MTGSMKRMMATAAAIGSAAILALTMSIVPVRAATATFPIVPDCSPFADFYSSWDKLPNTLYADNTRWTPQGLAYDEDLRRLYVSYYDGRDGVPSAEKYPSMLAVLDLNGTLIKSVSFNTANVLPGGHVGGLAVGKGDLYVASTDAGPGVTIIPLSVIDRAPDGSMLPATSTVDLPAASYASYFKGRLYVGDFEADLLYSYRTDRAGHPILASQTSYPTPTLIQGLAVTKDEFIFSRSYGRTRLSYLTTVDRGTGAESSVAIPNMSQGLTWAPARPRSQKTHLYVLFESGSATYGPDDDGGATTCATRELWHTAPGAIG
jgi:hypothetical protein